MPATAALRTVQYLTDTEGRRTGVLLDIQAWESLVEWIENATDVRAAAKALTELMAGHTALCYLQVSKVISLPVDACFALMRLPSTFSGQGWSFNGIVAI